MENYQSPPMFKIFAFLSCEVIKNNASFKNKRKEKREKQQNVEIQYKRLYFFTSY